MNKELADIFAVAKLRLTTPRIEIFNVLKAANGPMAIIDIAKACPSIDKVSVYRTIKLFDKLDIITAVTIGWKHSYELSAPFIPHHHHMICTKCGSLIELRSDRVEKLIKELSEEHKFTPSAHHFEVSGICSVCA